MAEDLATEGSISFYARHRNPAWPVDGDVYRFPDVRSAPIVVSAVKQADRTIHVTITGPFGARFEFTAPIPPVSERGLHIALAWVDSQVALYLNGERCETLSARALMH